MKIPETPLFVKTHDFVLWLLRHTQRFPKHLRATYTSRLETLAFDFEEALLMANVARGSQRRTILSLADGKLLCLRMFLRYATDLELLGGHQVKFAAESLDELGRLLGAWQKVTDR
ncbi:MAG: four helix bundle protein [Planctomycetaceae bacterium]|nr:four helix bundle protein [Planctomycetaceae bacterium]